MEPTSGRRLLRSIGLTLSDPWQLFGTVAFLLAVFAIALVFAYAHNLQPHPKKGTHEFTIVAITTPGATSEPSPVDVTPAPVPEASPSAAPSAAPYTGVLPTQSATSRATTRPTSRATTTATAKPTTSGPTAALSVTVSGRTVTAIASGSGGSGRLTYLYDFGDGYIKGPIFENSWTHQYATSYQYRVTIVDTDAAGNSSSASQTVIVGP